MTKENYTFLKDANEEKIYNLALCIEDYYCKKMYEPLGIASRKLVEYIVKKIADKLNIEREFLKDKKTGFVTLDSSIKVIFSKHLASDDYKYFKDLLFAIKSFGNKCSHEISENFDIEKESIDILQGVYRVSCYYYKFFINENLDWYKQYQIPEQFDDKEIEALLKENKNLKDINSDLENILLNKDEELANEKQKNDKFYEAVDKLSSSFEDVKKELNEYKNQAAIEFKRLQLEKNNSDIQDLASVINPKDFKDYESFIKDLNAYKISKEYDITVNDALEMLEENSFQEVCEALNEASKKINASKEEECPQEDYYKQGFANFISKNYENSLHYFNLCVENDINTANAYYYIGCIFQTQEKNKNAIESFCQAIELSPDEPLYYNMRANAYYDIYEYKLALNDFNKVLELDNNYSIDYFRYAYSQDDLEMRDEAIESYGKYIKQASDEDYNKFYCYYNRGLIYKKEKEYEKAIDEFTRAIGFDSQDMDSFYKRGECYYFIEEYEKALDDYNNVLENDSDYKINYFDYAYTQSKTGLTQESIDNYTKYIEQADDNDYLKAYAYNNRGTRYKYLDEYEKAIEDYNKAIKLDNKYTNAYRNRAEAYYFIDEYKKALNDFNKVLELDKDFNIDYFRYAYVQDMLELYEEAVESYTIFIEQADEDDDRVLYAYNNRGLLYQEFDEYKKAIEDFTKAIELDNKYIKAYKNRAEAHYELKEFSLALEDYNKVLELSDDKTKDPKMLICEIEQVMPREEFKKFIDEN